MNRSFAMTGLRTVALVLGLSLASAASWSEEPPAGGGDPAQPRAVPSGPQVALSGDAWMRYEDAQVRFEQPRFGGDARLLVRENVDPAAPSSTRTASTEEWRVYRGADLDAIRRANVDLTSREDLRGLRHAVAVQTAGPEDASGITSRVLASVESPGLVYEMGATGTSRLFVRDLAGKETLYVGSDLATILRTHPRIEQIAGFQDFRRRALTFAGLPTWTMRADASTILVVSHTPTGIVATTHEWRDGRWTTLSYRGQTLDEIRTAQPELRALLTAPGAAPALPFAPSREVQPFGVVIATPPPCLDSQLRLEGRGALVTGVTAGSTAARMGIQDHDVIVEIEGRPATDCASVTDALAQRQTEARTKLVVVRHSDRVALGN